MNPHFPSINRTLFIFTEFRSGSNLLCRYLKNNRFGDPAEHFQYITDSNENLGKTEHELKSRLISTVLNQTDNRGTFAVKVTWAQWSSLNYYLERLLKAPRERTFSIFPNPEFIYLERQDVIAQAVSLWRAESTGEWFHPKDRPPTRPQTYDFNRIMHFLNTLSSAKHLWARYLAENNLLYRGLNYEADLTDQDKLARLFSELWNGDLSRNRYSFKTDVQRQADAFSEQVKKQFWDDLQRMGAPGYWWHRNRTPVQIEID